MKENKYALFFSAIILCFLFYFFSRVVGDGWPWTDDRITLIDTVTDPESGAEVEFYDVVSAWSADSYRALIQIGNDTVTVNNASQDLQYVSGGDYVAFTANSRRFKIYGNGPVFMDGKRIWPDDFRYKKLIIPAQAQAHRYWKIFLNAFAQLPDKSLEEFFPKE